MNLRAWVRPAAWALAWAWMAAGPAYGQDAQMDRIRQTIERNLEQGVRAPEFPSAEWLNVDRPLSLSSLRGKIVLLDFWTYCCINCQHVIPELKLLEAKYPDTLVVIGVHSAKFENEKDSDNIRKSILRHEIRHPVVNDADFRVWRQYAVRAWPTLVLIAPDGRVALAVSGEGNGPALDRAIETLLGLYERQIDRSPVRMALETEETTTLRFPGKIFADAEGLVLSDSNHNRVLLAGFDGRVTAVIGSGRQGSRDGSWPEAEFNHPQGVLRDGSVLYVADTENHLIRRVDLERRTVETIAGTGEQGSRLFGESPALRTPLNSPWDLAKDGDRLYVAMAGAHQIWTLEPGRGVVAPLAGDGREDIRDGSFASAQFAQPSGLSLDSRGFLYVADSEVSAVRRLDLAARKVETLAGEGLFEFGDRDGPSRSARLQHCLGVHAYEGAVYVADTYNHKIKKLDPERLTIDTLAGSGEPGSADGSGTEFHEPGGLWAHGRKLYVADTNNHAVREVDLSNGRARTIEILESLAPPPDVLQTPAVTLASAGGRLELSFRLPAGHGYTEGQPLEIEWTASPAGVSVAPALSRAERPERDLPIRVDVSVSGVEEGTLMGTLRAGICASDGPKLCKWVEQGIRIPVRFAESAPDSAGVAVGIRQPDGEENVS